MKRKIKSFLICLLFIILSSQSSAVVDLSKLVEKIQPAVATIFTYEKGKKPLSQGTGFFIDKNGSLITNYHVLNGAYSAEVLTYDRKKYSIKLVIAENKAIDLIKVLVEIPENKVQWINVTMETPKIAERIIAIGSPMGLEQTVSEGIISAFRDLPRVGKIFQISTPISSGSSGSPVINMNGEVIAIVSFQIVKGQNLNFAIPSKYLNTLEYIKPSKTIANWGYDTLKKNAEIESFSKTRLFVDTEPEDAKIRILNIKPKYYRGIQLQAGRYLIEVSSKGYVTKKLWVNLNPKTDRTVSIKLNQTLPIYERKIVNSLGMSFIFVSPGNYTVGSPPNEHNSGPYEFYHKVSLQKGFYIQTTEVTMSQWKAVMKNNPLRESNSKSFYDEFKKENRKHLNELLGIDTQRESTPKIYDGDDFPVALISWNAAQEFIFRLNELEGTDKYQLPTSDEWEIACRAGTKTRYYWGNLPDCTKANYGGSPKSECSGKNPGDPTEVGSYPPNPWGLYDMLGNVEEWVQEGIGGDRYWIRGCSYVDIYSDCRCARKYVVSSKAPIRGFRLIKNP